MTLSRLFSGGKPQRGEDRVGSGRLGLRPDPFLHTGEAFGRLMDVVPLDDVGEGFEELIETFRAAGCGPLGTADAAGAAAPRAYHRHPSSVLSHANAFPLGIPARVENHPIAG